MESYIFFSSHGGPSVPLNEDSVNQRLHRISKKAHEKCPDVPLNMHSHVIRHTAASHWFNEDNINIIMLNKSKHSASCVFSLLPATQKYAQ